MSVGLVIQHAKRMRRITLSGSTIFYHITPKRHDFRKKKIEHKMCFDFLYNFVCKISHSKKNRAIYHKCSEVFIQSTRYPCQISRTLTFSRRISEKILKYSSDGIETRCGLDPPGDEIFSTRPARPWGPPSLL